MGLEGAGHQPSGVRGHVRARVGERTTLRQCTQEFLKGLENSAASGAFLCSVAALHPVKEQQRRPHKEPEDTHQ